NKFFVGFVMQNQVAATYPIALDKTTDKNRSWLAYSTTAGASNPNAMTNVTTTGSVGLGGNICVRALLIDPTIPGRCCLANGTCNDTLHANACAAAGGAFAGPNTSCTNFTCPQPSACCQPDGTCTNVQSAT